LNQKFWDITYTELGRSLIDNWNLPQELVAAIEYHHNPFDAPLEHSRITLTLFIADCICQAMGVGFGDMPYPNKAVLLKCLQELALEQEDPCSYSEQD
jgi:HD-like signal output (HDOD) protein